MDRDLKSPVEVIAISETKYFDDDEYEDETDHISK